MQSWRCLFLLTVAGLGPAACAGDSPATGRGVVVDADAAAVPSGDAGAGDVGDARGPSTGDAVDGAAADGGGAGDCSAGAACPAEHFCSLPRGACVSKVVGVAAGSVHTCTIHKDGRVSCWGYGPYIGPGLPTVTAPVAIPLGGKATAVAVGIQAACALLGDTTVRCWGDFGRGAVAPTKIANEDGTALTGVTQITGGSLAFCASTPAGTHCWGINSASELGRPPAMMFSPHTAVLAQMGPRRLMAATVAIVVHDGATQLCGWGNNDSGIVPGARAIVERPTCNDDVPSVLELQRR